MRQEVRHYVADDARALALSTLFAGAVGWFAYLLLWSGSSWLHPELLGTAAYVWNFPETASISETLRKIFDWKAFDPNVNRVRPFNDVFEVIDAGARPYLTRWLGPQASLAPSTVLVALLAPAAMYAWLRRATGQTVLALVLCMIFIASAGFLSLALPYIRPAKKLNLVLLCAALLFAERYQRDKRPLDFAALWTCLLASFLSDELGLANFGIIGVLYWRSLFPGRLGSVALWYLSLPILFLAITKWALPAIYKAYSVHGAWDALADAKKFEVFAYLLDAQFYAAAAVQTARSVLSTVGISLHGPGTEVAALVVLIAAPVFHAYFLPLRTFRQLIEDRFILATIVLCGASLFATLLDWYPFPYEVSYLGSYNYYYHSSIVVPVIVWLAFGCESLWRAVQVRSNASRSILAAGTIALGFILVPANFVMFDRINRLVQVIHLYPFSNAALNEALAKASAAPPGHSVEIELRTERARMVRQFEEDLHKLFGAGWKENGYYKVFQAISPTPIMSRAHVDHLFRAFLPFTKVNVAVKEENDR